MSIHAKFPVGIALSLIAVTAAEARGPSARPWLIYPAEAIESCRAGTAPARYAARCSELLDAYSRALLKCGAAGEDVAAQSEAQSAHQACVGFAARSAAGQVK